MRIIQFERSKWSKTAGENSWSPHTMEIIKQLIEEWGDTHILLAFKDNGKDLHAYMPIPLIGDKGRAKGEDKLPPVGEAKIIGIEPYPLMDLTISNEDGRIIEKIMRQNYWSGDELYRIGDHPNHQEFEDTPVTLETIEVGRERVRAVEATKGKTPVHIVNAVEALQREYDKPTGGK